MITLMKKNILRNFFIFWGLLLFFLFSGIFGREALAQSAPFVCPALGTGWQADISLRDTSWHHRATVKNTSTQVSFGLLPPGGDWVKPDLVAYGDGGGYSDPGTVFFYHTWAAPGSYVITITYRGCSFSRTVYVADNFEYIGSTTLDQNNKYYKVARPGKQICGTSAGYYQWVSGSAQPLSQAKINYSMPSLGGNPNAYCGQNGGLPFSPGLATFLLIGQSNVPGADPYNIVYPLAGKDTDTADWQITLDSGAIGGWTINYLNLYYNCKPSYPAEVIPTPTLVLPRCDSSCGVCGVKTTSGICTNDWGNATYKLNCCHMACVSNACQYVVGGGSWSCSSCSITSTPAPKNVSPTLTPTPIKVKNPYCVSLGLYPCGPYQDKGGNGNTDNLTNTYSKYVSFTVPFTGKVNGVAIKAGNWGGAQRSIYCKITNSTGTQNISSESDTGGFTSSSGVTWRKIVFPAMFTLTSGQTYRLYCRGSDTFNMVYWIYDPTKNSNNDLAKLYGRTYAVCMQ